MASKGICLMGKFDYLINCISWEERYSLGTSFIFDKYMIEELFPFQVKEFELRTSPQIDFLISNKYIKSEQLINPISMNEDIESWQYMEERFSSLDLKDKKILIDITTMPRFLIWNTLHFLLKYKAKVSYIYFCPKSYADKTWLSCDPLTPKLMLKHSGIFLPDNKTMLIIQTGFDIERISQLINMFEPSEVFLASQTGEQFDNLNRNHNRITKELSFPDITNFEINAFSNDHGSKDIESKILKYKGNFNIILCSLGPKPNAIAMFKLNLIYPEVGLVYTPAKEYNENYSLGINLENYYFGDLNFTSP